MSSVVLGVDIGTSSSKGVVADLDGTILATAARDHEVQRPVPGHVEMDPEVWWREFCDMSRELAAAVAPEHRVGAVGVSGMGPCAALTTATGTPVRPAILYGVDTRTARDLKGWTDQLGGADRVLKQFGSVLTTQAAGPKIAWVAEHEPDAYARAERLFMPASYLGFRLTGAYVLDHHSASQCTPLYDPGEHQWLDHNARIFAPGLPLPQLRWPGDLAGKLSAAAAAATGLPAGIDVIVGTIDAWSEALSVDAHNAGDLMLMYGTTLFMVNTITEPARHPALWGTVGALPDTHNLAGGMATSGAITGWLRRLFGNPEFPILIAEAQAAGVGAHGLMMLPYFAGERTPIMDPDARGVVAGLTIEHSRGDLYRAALEATAFGIRHNIEAIEAAGGQIQRVIAVGGGTKGSLWTQIVSDVTGRAQVIPTQTIGASSGAAWLASQRIEPHPPASWNPPAGMVEPDPETAARYDALYADYRALYPATVDIVHRLAQRQRESHELTHQKEKK